MNVKTRAFLAVGVILGIYFNPIDTHAGPLGTGLQGEGGAENATPVLPPPPNVKQLQPIEKRNGTTFYTIKDTEVTGGDTVAGPVPPDGVPVSPPTGGGGGSGADPSEPIIAISPDPLPNCPPEAPIRIDATTCVNDTMMAIIAEDGGGVYIDPDTGTASYYTEPDDFSTFSGGYAFDPEVDNCNPNVQVLLQEAAVAGSQVTRGMVTTQLDYPQVDPIVAVNNPQPDGYGGSCTIPLITYDFLNLIEDQANNLLQSLSDIVGIINAIANFDIDSLFGAACQVVGNILGDVQEQLLADVEDNIQTALQQLINEIDAGFIAPLQTFLDVAVSAQETTVQIDGVVTGSPLVELKIPDLGYVYISRLQDGTAIVLHTSPTRIQ